MFQKKFFLILIIIIALSALFLTKEIRRAFDIVTEPKTEPLISEGIAPIPMDDVDIVFGNPGAPLTVIEFADLGCSKCKQTHYALISFISKHPQEMRLIWKDAPIRGLLAKGNNLAHEAAYCAGKQKQFWKFVETVMQDKNNLKEPGLTRVAEALTLNMPAWRNCLDSKEPKQKIAASEILAVSLGIRAVPAVFVNNRKILLDENINLEDLLAKLIAR